MISSLIKNTVVLAALVLIASVLIVYYGDFKEAKNRKEMVIWADKNKIMLSNENASIKEFKIEFDQNEWEKLKLKLDNARYFKKLDEKYVQRHDYGFDPEYSEILVNYWRTNFDWKQKVDYLNKHQQFRLETSDGVTIHYLRYTTNKHLKGKPVKLLMFDGWPGHFFGFYKMIDFIENIYNSKSFEIIVPSIPGYGYSTPLTRPLDAVDTAQYFDALMRYLFDDNNCQYFIHGEDWGSVIAVLMAKLYPDRVSGIHVTMPHVEMSSLITLGYGIVGQIQPNLILTQEEINAGFKYGLLDEIFDLIKKSGYFHIQATKPDTLAHGLTDSPVGLLAWILEKYSLGSFRANALGKLDGNLEVFDRDDLLTIVTYYWMTNSISSSMRFYRTHWMGLAQQMGKYKVEVPTAVQLFKNEVVFYPLAILKNFYLNITSYHIELKGGHFASFENPELSAKDFVSFVNSL